MEGGRSRAGRQGNGTSIALVQEVETGKGRQWGAIIFIWEEGEEMRWLHGVGDGRHSEERCGDQGGQRRRLASEGRR
jgi:hypothetical protein